VTRERREKNSNRRRLNFDSKKSRSASVSTRRRDVAFMKIRDFRMSDVKSRLATLSTSIDGEEKKKEIKNLEGSRIGVIEEVNGEICPFERAASTAFSAVILEVYEVCRNRISLYDHRRPLAICSRANATFVSRECEILQEVMRDTVRQHFKQTRINDNCIIQRKNQFQ